MKVRRFLLRGLIGLLIIALVLGVGGMYYFKSYLPQTAAARSFPQIEGNLKVEGLDETVEVVRDGMGIPHIYATTLHDLFFTQGYVHAQDRFWQMDFWRHIGSARLSEMFGAGQVETDAFLRTLGWRHIAEAELENLSPESKAIVDAYTSGVNAYLKDHQGQALSLEYAILKLLTPDYQIEEWTPIHSLTWAKAMAWDLRGNMGEEIERAVLLKTLTAEQVDMLFPVYPQDHPVIVSDLGESTQAEDPRFVTESRQNELPVSLFDRVDHNASLLDPLLGTSGRGIGSNSWVVSGKLTDTGMPIFANDPHLSSQMPSIWYQIGLHCRPVNEACPFEVGGFSFAGVPGVIIGHNNNIVWGMTNTGPDVMDLYIERVNPENPDQYEVNGEWIDFEKRQETIQIAGGEPVTITVRSTRHGPVISDTYGPVRDEFPPEAEATPFKDQAGIDLPERYVISLKWTALEPSPVFESIWRFNKAENWEEFREAARTFNVPAQNLLYADTQGNIGYQMPGWIPLRANGEGRFPVPGWTDEFEWTGFIPFEELPYSFNPENGYIATANNQTHPFDYPYLVTADFDYGYRAARIVDLIENAPGPIDIAYVESMQGDTKNLSAELLIPVLAGMQLQFPEPNQALAFEMLDKWDHQNTADSQAAAVYEYFWWNLLQNTFNDDLPENYPPTGGDRWFEVMRHLVETPDDLFWDDKSTDRTVETRDVIFVTSLAETVNQLEEGYGKDPKDWPRWGQVHTITFRNGTLGESGVAPIEALFNRGPFETGGGKSIVNATGWDVGVSFEVDWLPSMRMIVDLGDLNRSVTVHTTGQSGHAYHPHYDDMAPLWAAVQYYPMWWDQQSIELDAEGHLRLNP
jgi:penicillin amidase